MRESAIVRTIMNKVRETYPDSYCRKISDRFTRGLPDILIQVRIEAAGYDKWVGATLYVETKTPTGKIAKLQELEREAILRAGGHHLFARDAETVMKKLEEMGAI